MPIKICQWCQREFHVEPRMAEKGGGVFCSFICHSTSEAKIKPSDYDRLRYLYVDLKWSTADIANEFRCTKTVVVKFLHRNGVSLRNHRQGETNGMYGRTHTAEAREKIRLANFNQFNAPGARDRHAELTAKQIQEGRTGKTHNVLETAFAQLLDEQQIEYQWQMRLRNFVFDFWLLNTNILIESHGTFWHADPRFYDQHKLTRIQRRNTSNDKRKEETASKEGFRLFVFWEHDIHNETDSVRHQIKQMALCPD